MDSILIPWKTGTGNIIIKGGANGRLLISSTSNQDIDRELILTFKTTKGNATATLLIKQKGTHIYFIPVNSNYFVTNESSKLTVKK